MGERTRNESELTKLVVTAPRDQVDMLGEAKFLVKSDTQVTDRERK